MVIGRALFGDDLVAQSMVTLGAIAPDIALVPQYALDKISGKQPLEHIGKKAMFAYEIGVPLAGTVHRSA
jgi:hypothetical protein